MTCFRPHLTAFTPMTHRSSTAEVEHIKGVKSPDDEQTAVLATEAEVKKALFEDLQASAGSGLPSFEKTVAKEWGGPFLENLELNLEPYWISFLQ